MACKTKQFRSNNNPHPTRTHKMSNKIYLTFTKNTFIRNRSRNLQTSKAPLKRQSQSTSLFTSAASNQRGCSKNSPWEAQVRFPDGQRRRNLGGEWGEKRNRWVQGNVYSSSRFCFVFSFPSKLCCKCLFQSSECTTISSTRRGKACNSDYCLIWTRGVF